MKKLVLLMTFTFAVITAFAQINQGQWMLGGNAAFSSTKDVDDAKVTTIQLNPNVGYFFINNLAGGLRLSYLNFDYEDEGSSSEVAVAPFVRYYFLPATQKVNLFADASYGFGSAKYEIGEMNETEGFNSFSIMAGPSIFLTPNVALEFALGYTSEGGEYYDYGDNDRANTFGINIGFQIHLGKAKTLVSQKE